jgi:cytochrome c
MMGRRGVLIGGAVIALVGLMSFPRLLFGSDQPRAKEIIQQTCVQCHRLEGQPDSRFNLKAPDLIWAGSKYQRSWLIRWLTGKEGPLYAKGYRWDLTEVPSKHPMVTESEANDKQAARLESLRFMLNLLPYKGKEEAPIRLAPDPNVITRFHRKMVELDL